MIAAATAVRPERRRFAAWTAAALFLAATWVRLAVWEVTTPEAYTLPVTVPALVVGFLRRRRDPEASSWTAYGPGLAATLLPSLFAAWTDPEWVRPLVLGVAALVVTLLGARFRLQALLVLGGTVLALDGLHELAPYVVQAVGALPRWLPCGSRRTPAARGGRHVRTAAPGRPEASGPGGTDAVIRGAAGRRRPETVFRLGPSDRVVGDTGFEPVTPSV